MSLSSKLLTTILAMLIIYGTTFWMYPSWKSSLIVAVAVGVVSVFNIARTTRRNPKDAISADTLWYFFGSTFVFWIAAFVIDWLVHQ